MPLSSVTIPAETRQSLSVPYPVVAKRFATDLPRVKTWITPPIASEP